MSNAFGNRITYISFIVGTFLSVLGFSQKYEVDKGSVSFFSDAAIEDISAENTKPAALFNLATGEVAFIITIRDFQFDKSLMQQHFNEKYMESDKYPRSTFQGTISGYDRNNPDPQPATARGSMTIHGKTNEITVPGTITIDKEVIKMNAEFMVELKDYEIDIPRLLWQNIAERVKVTLDFTFMPI